MRTKGETMVRKKSVDFKKDPQMMQEAIDDLGEAWFNLLTVALLPWVDAIDRLIRAVQRFVVQRSRR